MKLKLITEPAVEPVTLDEVKAQLAIVDTLQDDILRRRIREVREYVELFLSRALITQTWEIAMDDFPPTRFYRYPVQSIESVKYFDGNDVEQTLATTVYILDDYERPQEKIRLRQNQSWPSTNMEVNNVKVRFVAGYGDDRTRVPGPIRESIILIIEHWTKFQANNEIGALLSTIPFAIEQQLHQYRIVDNFSEQDMEGRRPSHTHDNHYYYHRHYW